MVAGTTTYLLTRAEINEASRAVLWMTGSVYASNWGDVASWRCPWPCSYRWGRR